MERHGLGEEIPRLLVSSDDGWTHPEYGVQGVLGLGLEVAIDLTVFV